MNFTLTITQFTWPVIKVIYTFYGQSSSRAITYTELIYIGSQFTCQRINL